ncbi:MAG TPA: hypothetical protein VF176_04390 [Solirubrobacterales bacterium]
MIVEAVEQAAEKIIVEAEDEARRYVGEAKRRADEDARARAGEVDSLIEALDGCAVRLREEMNGLIDVLGEIRAGLAEAIDSTSQEDSSGVRVSDTSFRGRLREVKAVSGPEGESFTSGPERDGDARRVDATSLDAARLLATQMAMAGTAREKVQACLEREISRDEATPIIEAVFGPEA